MQHSAESLHQGSHKGSLAKAQAAEALRCAGLHTAHVEVTFEGELLLFIRWDDPWGGFGQERYYLSDEDTMICVRPLAVCSDLLHCWQHTGLALVGAITVFIPTRWPAQDVKFTVNGQTAGYRIVHHRKVRN